MRPYRLSRSKSFSKKPVCGIEKLIRIVRYLDDNFHVLQNCVLSFSAFLTVSSRNDYKLKYD